MTTIRATLLICFWGAFGCGNAAAADGSPIVHWFERGGIFMWPLLVCSVLGLALLCERLLALQSARLGDPKFPDAIVDALDDAGPHAALRLCTDRTDAMAAIFRAGLERAELGAAAVEKAMEARAAIEASGLQRGIAWIATISNIAPLFGFLGTVSGMIHAFEAIASAEQVSAKIVASGIAEALITTEAGLLIAIPAQAAHNFFVARVDRFLIQLESSAHDLLEAIGRAAWKRVP